MPFKPAISPPPNITTACRWFLYHRGDIVVIGDALDMPKGDADAVLSLDLADILYLGLSDGMHCFTAEIHNPDQLPPDASLVSLRSLFGQIDDSVLQLAGHAFQLLRWKQTHRYCGRCGKPNRMLDHERTMLCDHCGLSQYPRISPAVIVSVVKDDQILLAHNKRFPEDFYSVLAGFVEAGETLEKCVHREIREEVGIEVKNIRYFGSQPWPYPDSLMVAFTADFDSGELLADGDEITHADWFGANDLPPRLPYNFSIASKLIKTFTETHKSG